MAKFRWIIGVHYWKMFIMPRTLSMSEADPFFRLPPPPTRQPYRVRTIGLIHSNPHHVTLGTYFNDAMLLYCFGGRGYYQVGGQTTTVGSGQVGLILPGGEVGRLWADPIDPYNHLQCRFGGRAALATARRIAANHGGNRFFMFAHGPELAEVLRHALNLFPGQESEPRREPERLRRVDAVLAEALALLEDPRAPVNNTITFERLRAYMHEHLHQPIALDPMAAYFGVSKAHLCRTARRVLGVTIQPYWERLKMVSAQALLREPRLSTAEVARRVGYHDPFYFSKIFKRNTGQPPRDWRKSALENTRA